ncbi:LLM class flavin-dependent oxidoreductase [Phytohabitans suffuscus]|uniref:LLM class flavin-dependent oxidoreductase n=1 Tax=Phytohabitans suffuscus TaxID=624315 RepID=UPI0015638477|nr:LLM class flavin-dependent oxidoreductase [Phytohabitans suffuscus]
MGLVNRWGLSLGVSPREPLTNVPALAALGEALGFEALWYIDFQLGMKDVYAAMYLAAQATSRMEIGSAVTNLQTRHPTVTANATAALDELSGGRALLGLGAGWSAVLGAGYQPARMPQIRAGIAEFRRLFTGEEQELYGTTVKLATARRQVPIYLAASQPGMLRLAGEVCDGLILLGAADPDFCRWQLDYVYQGLERAGRDRGDLTIDLFVTMSVDLDEAKARADVAAWATAQAATFESWKTMPPSWERFRPQFAAARGGYELVEHLSLHAGHKAVVTDEFISAIAVPGPVELCAERLRALATLDVDRLTFPILSGGRERRMREIAETIIPLVGEPAATVRG